MFKSIITDQISMDLEEALKITKKLNYDSVEIHSLWGKTVETLNAAETIKAKNLLQKYDIKLSCLGTTLFFMCPLYDDYTLDNFNSKFITFNGNYEDHIEGLKKAAEISNKLGAPFIRIFPFRLPSNKKIVVNDDDIKLITEKISNAANIAEKLDVILALENCPHSHMSKGVMTKKVIDSIKNNHLKLLWDVGNNFRAPVDVIPSKYSKYNPYDELPIILDDIRHIHVKDYSVNIHNNIKEFNHITFGKGNIDFNKIIDELHKNKYKYSISLESEVNYEDTLESMINLKNMIKDI